MNKKTESLTTIQKAELVSGNSFWATREYEDAEVKSITFSDGPSGLRMQLLGKADSMGLKKSQPATCFPTHSSLSCSFNTELINGVGKRMGEEAACLGADVILAPAVNIKRNPLGGRNFEYFSEDPYLSGVLGAEFINGVQSQGVGACIKHFAANNKELGRTVYDSAVDMRTLREIYLTAFEIAVTKAKPVAVMTSYNKLNGVYCNENEWLINDVLRGEWGHDGIVVSDWGGTYDRVAAIKAGADLEMPLCKFSKDEVLSAIEEGALKEEELTACADRIVELSDKLNGEKSLTICDFDEHAIYAAKCAMECAVLLKNDGVLPLKEGVKFAVVGGIAKNPVIQGGGSSKVNPTHMSTLYGSLSRLSGFSSYSQGYFTNGLCSTLLINNALLDVDSADVIICCIGVTKGDAEGSDKKHIRLPKNQIELLNALHKTGKPIIAVLSCGGAIETDWDDCVNALVYAGLNGQGGARAIKDILTGKVNPSGKLSETFPIRAEDSPSYTEFNTSPYTAIYKEGMNVGYRYFHGNNVKYPFGYGLSYTSFKYSNLEVDEKGVTFTLENIGDCKGAEAVQTYITFPQSANAPTIQLKGFKKVVLEKGESASVYIPFDEYSFRSFDAENNKWVKVTGEYTVFVGSSSCDFKLSGKINIKGDAKEAAPCKTDGLKCEEYPLNFDDKGRIIADMHTPIGELVNSKACLIRLGIRRALFFTAHNPTVNGTMRYATVRTAAQFRKFDKVQAEGLLEVFNGKYFKGLYKIICGEKQEETADNEENSENKEESGDKEEK